MTSEKTAEKAPEKNSGKPTKKRASKKKSTKSVGSITSADRLQVMYEETEAELEKIQPQIEKLEKQLEKLHTLKQEKQKLITLKLSLKSIIDNFNGNDSDTHRADTYHALGMMASSLGDSSETTPSNAPRYEGHPFLNRIFLPDQAFMQADKILKRRQSLNYEIFRAIVFKGGKATSEQIKQYLIENDVKQPATGKGFEEVDLAEISSRTNYLVRRDVVESDGHGHFVSRFGWQDAFESSY